MPWWLTHLDFKFNKPRTSGLMLSSCQYFNTSECFFLTILDSALIHHTICHKAANTTVLLPSSLGGILWHSLRHLKNWRQLKNWLYRNTLYCSTSIFSLLFHSTFIPLLSFLEILQHDIQYDKHFIYIISFSLCTSL